MDQLSDVQLEKIINNVSIFCRVTPKHKVTIVKVEIISALNKNRFLNLLSLTRLFNELATSLV